jgi:peptidoglycan hydrolase-like protein with peptidoglycan-binding domain
MLIKRIVLCLSIVPLLLLSGCVATLGKNNISEVQSLRNQVSVLEKQLRYKDEEIDSLKDALNAKKIQRRTVVSEIKSRPKARQIQMALKNAGYYQGAIDGKIGKRTRRAIKKFQKENGLKVDGKVGRRTWSVLGKYL